MKPTTDEERRSLLNRLLAAYGLKDPRLSEMVDLGLSILADRESQSVPTPTPEGATK